MDGVNRIPLLKEQLGIGVLQHQPSAAPLKSALRKFTLQTTQSFRSKSALWINSTIR